MLPIVPDGNDEIRARLRGFLFGEQVRLDEAMCRSGKDALLRQDEAVELGDVGGLVLPGDVGVCPGLDWRIARRGPKQSGEIAFAEEVLVEIEAAIVAALELSVRGVHSADVVDRVSAGREQRRVRLSLHGEGVDTDLGPTGLGGKAAASTARTATAESKAT